MNFRNILMQVMENHPDLYKDCNIPPELIAQLSRDFETWKQEKYKNRIANDLAKAALEETLPRCCCVEVLGKDAVDCPIHGAMNLTLYVENKDGEAFWREIRDFEKRWYTERNIELKDETPTPPSLL